jgi:hypothetical protein
MDEREAVFQNLDQIISEKRSGAENVVSATQEPSPATVSSLSSYGNLEKLEAEVNEFLRNHEYQKAKMFLLRYRIRAGDADEADAITRAIEEVEQAEARTIRSDPEMGIQKNEDLEQARQLIEEEKYEEAIRFLEQARDIGPYSYEMDALRDLAIEKHINAERNEAARLYLLATKTHDRDKKKELLMLSYNKLEALIDKYPLSPLIKKIKEHADRVDKSLEQLKSTNERYP